YARAGYATADSIATAIDHMMKQSYIRKGRVLLAGHSAGAWGALALASQNPNLVSGVINFAGGRGGRANGVANRNCAPERLISTTAHYGRTMRPPSLWLYSVNDTYFGPGLARQLAEAFRNGAARVDFRLLPSSEDEGHYLVFYPD